MVGAVCTMRSVYALNVCVIYALARDLHLPTLMNAKSKGRIMGESERAVYELLEHGPISAAKSVLYASSLEHLVAARLVRRTTDGGYELTRKHSTTIRRSEPPHLETLTASVPAECVEFLDRLGPTRDAALLAILRRWAGSGIRRKT